MKRLLIPLIVLAQLSGCTCVSLSAAAKSQEKPRGIHKLFGHIGHNRSLAGRAAVAKSDSHFITEFNNRRTQVEVRIADAAASGRLTVTQAADLRATLSGIVFRKDDYADTGRITDRQQHELLIDLDRLNGTVSLALKGPQYWM